MLVIDYVLYNGEPIIEFRLKYLYKHVDIFIIVESMFTHSGNKKKDLYYNINKDHLMYKDVIDSLDSKQKEKFEHLISYIESYLPIDNIFARKSAEEVEQPLHEDDKLREKFELDIR